MDIQEFKKNIYQTELKNKSIKALRAKMKEFKEYRKSKPFNPELVVTVKCTDIEAIDAILQDVELILGE